MAKVTLCLDRLGKIGIKFSQECATFFSPQYLSRTFAALNFNVRKLTWAFLFTGVQEANQ